MSMVFTASGGNVIGRQSASAGTVWYAVVPGFVGTYTRLVKIEVDNGATNNGIYVMRAIGYAILQQAQTTSDSTVILDRDPSASGNTIASGDQVVMEFSDGTYRRCQVSSWNASTLTLTLSATLPAAVSAGAYLWNYGIYTDTDPVTSLAQPLIDTPTSAVTTNSFDVGFAGWTTGEPLLLYCPNATNQTKLNYAEYGYSVV